MHGLPPARARVPLQSDLPFLPFPERRPTRRKSTGTAEGKIKRRHLISSEHPSSLLSAAIQADLRCFPAPAHRRSIAIPSTSRIASQPPVRQSHRALQSTSSRQPCSTMLSRTQEPRLRRLRRCSASGSPPSVSPRVAEPARDQATADLDSGDAVAECTDDPNLDRAGRKRAQVEHSPHISWDAQHVKLADKLSNLMSIIASGGPAGWPVQRIQESVAPCSSLIIALADSSLFDRRRYFQWSKEVTDGCKAANPGLGDQLEKLYTEGTFKHSGKAYPCLPNYP